MTTAPPAYRLSYDEARRLTALGFARGWLSMRPDAAVVTFHRKVPYFPRPRRDKPANDAPKPTNTPLIAVSHSIITYPAGKPPTV